MNITNLNIAKTAMTWHGIKLNEGNLYGYEAQHGAIYSRVPVATGDYIYFNDLSDHKFLCKLYDLPSNIHYYRAGNVVYFEEAEDLTEQTVQRIFDEGMDGNIYFEEEE